MKENFEADNIIKFKEFSDKIQSISDSEHPENEEDFDIDTFKDSGFAELFGQILSEELSKPYEPAIEEELYEEIVDNFFILIEELGIDKFNFFRFSNYNYYREIIIDGTEYDFDSKFSHDDLEATEALCAIDCLIADLGSGDVETILKNIERMINIYNKQ